MVPVLILSAAVLIAVFATLALCVSKTRPPSRPPGTPAPDEGVLGPRPSSRVADHNAASTLKSDHTAVDLASPRESMLSETPHGHSSKFASRFSSKRASSTSVQSSQSGAEGLSSENEGTDSDNDRISEEEDNQLRATQVAAARRRSSEFDRDSLADFASGPSREEDTGRAAAMAMRLMANLRNEHDERKRLQAIVEQSARPATGPSSAIIAGARPPASLLMGIRTPSASNTDSPVAQRAVKVCFASPAALSPADSPLGSRASTLAPGALRPLSQEFGLAVDAARGGVSTLPAQRAAKAANMTYKAKQQPDAYDPQQASADPVDLRATLKDAKSKLRPVSRLEDAAAASAEPSQCTFTADCKCASCR